MHRTVQSLVILNWNCKQSRGGKRPGNEVKIQSVDHVGRAATSVYKPIGVWSYPADVLVAWSSRALASCQLYGTS